MRTDEGVCPYIVGMLLFKEGVSSYRREAFLTSKKRPPRIEKGASSFTALWLMLTRDSPVTLDYMVQSILADHHFK